MFIFINPWAYYIANDDMPEIYSGNSDDDNAVIWYIIYVVVVSAIYLVGSLYLLNDLFFDYLKNHFIFHVIAIFSCIFTLVTAYILGAKFILKSKI